MSPCAARGQDPALRTPNAWRHPRQTASACRSVALARRKAEAVYDMGQEEKRAVEAVRQGPVVAASRREVPGVSLPGQTAAAKLATEVRSETAAMPARPAGMREGRETWADRVVLWERVAALAEMGLVAWEAMALAE